MTVHKHVGPHVGRAIPHEAAEAHVTGAAMYTDDLVGRYAGALHAWPVMAPHAHAKVDGIDSRKALEVGGVVTVLTADDVPGENDTGAARRDEPLFPEVVVYHGQAVCWVLAENEEQAKVGAAAVSVSYTKLDPIVGIEAAIAAESFHTDPLVIQRGAPADAIAAAPHSLEGELAVGGQEHFYLETQASLAYIDEDGATFVHSSTQHPSETQEICARVLGLEKNAVTCQSLRMGGAFGGKEVQANPWAAVAVLGAHATGRPVRVRLDRQRDFQLTGKRHPFLGRYRVGFDDDGSIVGIDVELFSDGGWSLDLSEPVMFRAMFHIDNAYHLPHARVVGRVTKTNTTSHTAFRGFGGPQGMVVCEEILDRIARHLGLPPKEVRERNFYQEGQQAHYGQPIKDAGRIERIWRSLEASSEWDARRGEVEAFNASRSDKKRGLAITPVKFGISFTTAFFNQAGALVIIYADGSVQVNHGGTEMGQGLHTKMLQVAADGLGLPLGAVRLMPTRTDKVPNASATAASAGTDLNGAAVKDACDQLRERLEEVAGRIFSREPGDMVFAEGRVYPFDRPDDAVPFVDVTRRAYLERTSLMAAGYYKTPHIAYDAEAGCGKPFHYYSYGAAVSEVEVDGFTGMFSVRRIDILHDVGDSLSPLVDRGQIEGAFAQGLGWLTSEELVWDQDGVLRTFGASTYKLPTLGECPDDFRVSLLPQAAEDGVIHGSKAVGEPPFMLAMSMREALREAVAAFGDAPKRVELACPSTPEAIFWAIEAVRGGSN